MASRLHWFPFFFLDFYADTFVRSLDRAGQGLYVQLLADQWADGFLPDDVEKVALRTHSERTAIALLFAKFPVSDDGKRRNEKLDELRAKAVKLSKTNRLNAVRSHSERRAKRERTQGNTHTETDITTKSGGAPRPQFSTDVETVSDRPESSGRLTPPPDTPTRQGWNVRAADVIRRECYLGKEPPTGVTLAEDLKWFRLRLDEGRSEDVIGAALRGAPLCMIELKGKRWSPARVFSKKGPWVNLFDRAVTADGRSGRPRPVSEILGLGGANRQ